MAFVIDPDLPFSLGKVKRIALSRQLLLSHGRHLTSFHPDLECISVLDTDFKLNPFSSWLDTLRQSRKNYLNNRKRLRRNADTDCWYSVHCGFVLAVDFALKSTEFVQVPEDVLPHHVSRISIPWTSRAIFFEGSQAFDAWRQPRSFSHYEFSCFLSWFLFLIKEKAEIPIDFLVSDDNAIHSVCRLLHDYRQPQRTYSPRSVRR